MLRPSRTEYLVLRRTIAQRGALRPILLVGGIGIWALTLIAVLVWLPNPLAFLIPLIVIAATFEAIRPLHFGAERIGRYLQAFYEEAGDPDHPLRDTPSWERVAMRFGKVPGVGGHPLFVPIFLLALAANYMAMMVSGPRAIDTVVMGVAHAIFGGWVFAGHRAMKTQREVELDRMRQLAK